MGDVRLCEVAVRLLLAEAALNDPSLLIFERLGSRFLVHGAFETGQPQCTDVRTRVVWWTIRPCVADSKSICGEAQRR